MTVPVLWVSRNPEILHRGYADQAMLEGFLDRSLWRPPNALEFAHYEVRGEFARIFGQENIPAGSGAVVVVPFRHMIDHVAWLRNQLDELAWSVVLLTSEEEWLGNWQVLDTHPDTRRLWVMQARPEHADLSAMLPCGWYPGIRDALTTLGPRERNYDWFFAGQITHIRRQEMAQAIGVIPGRYPGAYLGTEGYFQGIPPADYYEYLAVTKLIPCPSGPVSLCTARVEEALEAGCVPIVDLVKPTDPQFNYWEMLFPGHPFPTITDWSTLSEVVAEETAAWPANANRCWAFWQQWKRRISHKLDDDVRAVSGIDAINESTPDDLITVIVTTSPATMHPDTSHIEETIDSIREQLPDAEIVIVCDGVRPEQEKLRARYEEYQHALFWLTNFRWHNVVPLRLEEWQHQAGAVRAALELVTTPLVMLVEHDTPLKGTPIDWAGICAFVQIGEANVIRFHHEDHIHTEHEGLMVDHETIWTVRDGYCIPLRRTMAWWQRPHVASTRFYRERVMPFFTPESRTMIEDPLYGRISTDYLMHGESAWWDWRLWIYTPEGSMQRSYHLDSRGSEEKYAMRFGEGFAP